MPDEREPATGRAEAAPALQAIAPPDQPPVGLLKAEHGAPSILVVAGIADSRTRRAAGSMGGPLIGGLSLPPGDARTWVAEARARPDELQTLPGAD
jgi:hypothetical protein